MIRPVDYSIFVSLSFPCIREEANGNCDGLGEINCFFGP